MNKLSIKLKIKFDKMSDGTPRRFNDHTSQKTWLDCRYFKGGFDKT